MSLNSDVVLIFKKSVFETFERNYLHKFKIDVKSRCTKFEEKKDACLLVFKDIPWLKPFMNKFVQTSEAYFIYRFLNFSRWKGGYLFLRTDDIFSERKGLFDDNPWKATFREIIVVDGEVI